MASDALSLVKSTSVAIERRKRGIGCFPVPAAYEDEPFRYFSQGDVDGW